MGVEINPAVWGLLGTIVGAAVSVGTTWLTNAHASRLEAQKTRDSRAEAARAFQRQTLLDLTESLDDLAQKSLEVFRRELAQSRAGMPWRQGKPISDETAEAFVMAFRTVNGLVHRVSNEPLRLAVVSYLGTLSKSVTSDSMETAVSLRDAALNEYSDITVLLGECLLSYYDPV